MIGVCTYNFFTKLRTQMYLLLRHATTVNANTGLNSHKAHTGSRSTKQRMGAVIDTIGRARKIELLRRVLAAAILVGVVGYFLASIMVVDTTSASSSTSQFRLTENHDVAISSTRIIKISSTGEAVGDIVPGVEATASLLATLYMHQGSADDNELEGVTVIVDVGSSNSIPDRFDVVIARR